MDIIIQPIEIVSIVAICIMVGALVLAYFKKWMMTYALIFSNFIILVITMIFPEVTYELGFEPIYLSLANSPQIYTLFTSMFIHADFMHIIGNMLVFFFIGIPFEQRVGWKKFIAIYLIAGACGTLVHSLMTFATYTNELELKIPLIGASGAIFGIMGAFAISYPRDEITMPIPLGIIMIIRRVKVMYAVLLFAAMETVFVYLGGQGNTAHFAHIGGLIGGAVLAAILIRGKQTHTKKGETVYYDSFAAQKLREIDSSTLEKLADTPELKEMLHKIENETVPQVQEIWIEHFLEKATCPKCKKPLSHFGSKIWCEDCGFKAKY